MVQGWCDKLIEPLRFQGWLGKVQLIHRLGFGLSALITVAMLSLAWIGPAPLVRLEKVAMDSLFWLRGDRPVGEEIVLVGVDEKSLKEIGRWPWSRDKQAQLVDAIAADGPKVIGMDIIYSEPEKTEFVKRLHTIQDATANLDADMSVLQELLKQELLKADTDRQLAQSLRAAKNVVLALYLKVPETSVAGEQDTNPDMLEPVHPEVIPEYIKQHQFMLVRAVCIGVLSDTRGQICKKKSFLQFSGEAMEPYQATGANPPLKQLAEAARSLGHAYSIPDPDGITRYDNLALRYGGKDDYYPSFPLEIARVYLGLPRDRMALTLGEGVRLGDILIPVDQKARMLIDYLGRDGHFPFLSATDVLNGRVPPGTFRDKAVLVGTSAVGTYDQKATPFSANFPGIEKNATVVENIIHQRFLEKNVWSGPLELGLILLFGLGLGYVLPKVPAIPGAAIALGVFLGFVGSVYYLFANHGMSLSIISPGLTIALSFVSITVLRHVTVEREREEIRQLFTPYVGPQIVDQLIQDPSKAKVGLSQRRELTMLFCDIIGFTSFCERHSTEKVVHQVNEYLGAMTEVVFHWNGTLVDFMGDEVYAFWGAPLDQPNHAELAIKCALHMRRRLAELHEKWKAEKKELLDNGIGLNTGEVLVANIGAEGRRMKYAAVGDNVNLASRVSGLTRTFAVPIVVSEFTADHVKALMKVEDNEKNTGRLGHVALKVLAAVVVKGREKPVVVYELKTLPREEKSWVEELNPEDIPYLKMEVK